MTNKKDTYRERVRFSRHILTAEAGDLAAYALTLSASEKAVERVIGRAAGWLLDIGNKFDVGGGDEKDRG